MSDDAGDKLTVLSGSPIVDPVWGAEQEDEAAAIRARLHELRDQMLTNYFEIGRLVYRVRNTGYWAKWYDPNGKKYERIEEWVETELKLGAKSVGHYMNVWLWFHDLPNYQEIKSDLKEIGWSKAKMLIGVAGKETVVEWIDKARRLPMRDLEIEAQVALKKANMKRRPLVSLTGGLREALHAEAAAEQKFMPALNPMNVNREAEPLSYAREMKELLEAEEHPADRMAGQEMAVDSGLPYPGVGGDTPRGARKAKISKSGQTTTIDDQSGLPLPSPDDHEHHVYSLRFDADREQYRNIRAAIERVQAMAQLPQSANASALDFMATHFQSFYNMSLGSGRKSKWIAFTADLARGFERSFGVDLIILKKDTNTVLYGRKTLETHTEFHIPGEEEADKEAVDDDAPVVAEETYP